MGPLAKCILVGVQKQTEHAATCTAPRSFAVFRPSLVHCDGFPRSSFVVVCQSLYSSEGTKLPRAEWRAYHAAPPTTPSCKGAKRAKRDWKLALLGIYSTPHPPFHWAVQSGFQCFSPLNIV